MFMEKTGNGKTTYRYEKRKSILMIVLSILITLSFILVIPYISMYKIASENKDIILILIGNLSSAFLIIIGYYFGSSIKQNNRYNDN